MFTLAKTHPERRLLKTDIYVGLIFYVCTIVLKHCFYMPDRKNNVPRTGNI